MTIRGDEARTRATMQQLLDAIQGPQAHSGPPPDRDQAGLEKAKAAAGLKGARTTDIELSPEPVPLDELLRRAKALTAPPPEDMARQALIARMQGTR